MKGITVYTFFLVAVTFLGLFFLFMVMAKFLASQHPSKKSCEMMQKSFCLDWYSKGFVPEEKPKGYDFSKCKEYGIEEPIPQLCKRLGVG